LLAEFKLILSDAESFGEYHQHSHYENSKLEKEGFLPFQVKRAGEGNDAASGENEQIQI
jgi:hypothetical protein